MSVSSLPYTGFVDGANRCTQNLAPATWEIFAPTDELIMQLIILRNTMQLLN